MSCVPSNPSQTPAHGETPAWTGCSFNEGPGMRMQGYQPSPCYAWQNQACPSPPRPLCRAAPASHTARESLCLGSSLHAQQSVARGDPAWARAQPREVSCNVAHASHFTDEKAEAGKGAGTHLRSPSWLAAGLRLHPAQSGSKAGSLVPASQAP